MIIIFRNCFESIELEKEEEEGFEAGIIDPHEKMIHRLHRELAQRQELQTRLISILQKKQETENELMGKKRRIDDLRLHLQNLFKVRIAENTNKVIRITTN